MIYCPLLVSKSVVFQPKLGFWRIRMLAGCDDEVHFRLQTYFSLCSSSKHRKATIPELQQLPWQLGQTIPPSCHLTREGRAFQSVMLVFTGGRKVPFTAALGSHCRFPQQKASWPTITSTAPTQFLQFLVKQEPHPCHQQRCHNQHVPPSHAAGKSA